MSLMDACLQNVIFRFVPEIEQINHAMEVINSPCSIDSTALQVMKQNGRRGRAFSGIPVFHVDGLITVRFVSNTCTISCCLIGRGTVASIVFRQKRS